MKCDLCGTKDVTAAARVEGVLMNVCDACAKFGKVVSVMQAPPSPKKKAAMEKMKQKEEKRPELVEIVVPDYAKRVRTAREKKGILPKDFAKMIAEKESVVLHLEAGKMRPDLALAKKLERALHIILLEKIELKDEEAPRIARDTMTLGDLIKT